MKNGEVKCYFRPQGLQRKDIARIIAKVVNEKEVYDGPPTFVYRVGGWHIDRDGDVVSAEIPFEDRGILRQIFMTLSLAGVKTERSGMVAISTEGHSGKSLRNLVNIISRKDSLICKALGIGGRLLTDAAAEQVNDALLPTKKSFQNAVNHADKTSRIKVDFGTGTLYFFHVFKSLDPDEVMAAVALCYRLGEQAKLQKRASPIEKPVENEKYDMRNLLLRIGLDGVEFERERKTLLSRLSGDIRYRMTLKKFGKIDNS
ncbi:MAG: hypothetical protein N2Z65_06150 [Clostridiales bacterium]|nr:hypothetical protein [Clostridiales bacterium]